MPPGVCKYWKILMCPFTELRFRKDFGIQCLIAPSFGEIFFNNSMQNGLLPVILPQEQCVELAKDAESGLDLEVDLEKEEIRRLGGAPPIPFHTDPFRRHCLLNGLDDIALTMQMEDAIKQFEKKRTEMWPWLDGFGYLGNRIPVAQVKKPRKTDW